MAVALAEPHGSGAGRAGGDGEAVPAPERAVAADQTLTLEQSGRQGLAGRLIGHDADLGEAARQHGGTLHMSRKRLGPFGQRKPGGHRRLARDFAPMAGRPLIGRRRQIIAQGRPQRGLVAGGHHQLVDHRRPEARTMGGDQVRQSGGLGVDPVAPAPRRIHRLAPGQKGTRRLIAGDLRRLGRCLGVLAGLVGRGERRLGGDTRRIVPERCLDRRAFGRDLLAPLPEPRQPLGQLLGPAGQLGLPRLAGSQRLAHIQQLRLGFGGNGLGGGEGAGGLLDQGRGLALGGFDGSALLDQALDRGGGIGGQGLLAADIGLGLAAPALGLGGGGQHPLLLFLQAGLGDGQALELGGGLDLGLSQRR